MMMVIIPFLVYSAIKKIIPEFTYEIWTFAIPIAYFLILIMTALASLTGISFSEIGALLFGSSGLALNIWISLVMLKHLNQNFKVNKIPL
jgi:hypothetical protein